MPTQEPRRRRAHVGRTRSGGELDVPLVVPESVVKHLDAVAQLAGEDLYHHLDEFIVDALTYYLTHIESGLLDRAKGGFDDQRATDCTESGLADLLETSATESSPDNQAARGQLE